MTNENDIVSNKNISKGINSGHIGDIIYNIHIDTKGESIGTGKIELYRLCYNVLLHVKNNNMKIGEDEFKNICGEFIDDVLEELKRQKIGSFTPHYKSIWSINKKQLYFGLDYYKMDYSLKDTK